METVKARSQDLERLSKKIETLVETYTKRGEELNVGELQQQVNALMLQVTEALEQMDTVAANLVHQTGNVEYSLRATMTDLRDALESVRGLANQLKEDPSALIRGRGKTQE